MARTPILPPDWKEFLSLLTTRRVKFIVVGAHALAANGRPRNTLDLDILVEPTEANAKRLCGALQAFGFPSLAAAAKEWSTPDRMASLGREPLRIDVMTSISGVSFARAWRGRIRQTVDGVRLAFLGRAELLANKRASGRPKDLLDIELLKERKPSKRGG